MTFAARLDAWLRYLGVQPRELARRCGLSPQAIRNYLTGKNDPALSTLGGMIAKLNLSPAEFWGAVPEPRTPE